MGLICSLLKLVIQLLNRSTNSSKLEQMVAWYLWLGALDVSTNSNHLKLRPLQSGRCRYSIGGHSGECPVLHHSLPRNRNKALASPLLVLEQSICKFWMPFQTENEEKELWEKRNIWGNTGGLLFEYGTAVSLNICLFLYEILIFMNEYMAKDLLLFTHSVIFFLEDLCEMLEVIHPG